MTRPPLGYGAVPAPGRLTEPYARHSDASVIVARRAVLSLVFTGPPRGVGAAAAWLLVPIACVALIFGGFVAQSPAPVQNNHAELSLSLALAKHFCHDENAISVKYPVYSELTSRSDLLERPFAEVLASLAGSRAAYCASATAPLINNENSLMLSERAALAIAPSLSPAGLARALTLLRMVMVLVFAYALLVAGASVALATGAAVAGCAILRALEIRLTLYPFVLTCPLMLAGLYVLASVTLRRRATAARTGAAALVAGLLTGFAANARTSQLPLHVAMFALFLAAVAPAFDARSRRAAVAAAIVAFAIGYAAFDQAFIRPLRHSTDPNSTNYTYHAFAHSLVIGLGVPETELSRREGIRWEDPIGLELARRVDANVTFLGPTYERALLKYYARLWRRRPRLMLDAYWHKLRDAGNGVFDSLGIVGAQVGLPRAPATWLHDHTDGIFLLGLFGACVAGGLAWMRTGSPVAFAFALVSLGSLASTAESFLTLSVFVAMYFAPLLFGVMFLAMAAVQWLLDRIGRGAAWAS